MELSNKIDFQTQLTFAFSPLLYTIVSDGPHDATCAWFDYDDFICLDTDPSNEFIIILYKNLTFEEMCVETFTFGQYIQDLFSGLNFIHMVKSVILLEDVFLIILFFCISCQSSQSSLRDEILILKQVIFFILHFRMNFECGNPDDICAS